MPTNKFIPSIPEKADPQMRTHLRQLWDRLNYVLDEVERIKSGSSGETTTVQSQVSRLNVAIAAVQDKLAQQSTYVNFGGTTTVEGIDAAGQTGFAYVTNGSWSFVSGSQITASLNLYGQDLKGLTPGYQYADIGKFLSTSGWESLPPGVTTGVKGDINVVTLSDWQIVSGAVGNSEIADGAVGTSKLGQDVTQAGKDLLIGATAAAQRTTLGLGDLALATSLVAGASGDVTGTLSRTGSNVLSLANSGVIAGSYGSSSAVPVITVDAKGRITSASTAAISGALTFIGDVTGTGTTGSDTTLTLVNSGVTAGTYTKITVDAKGRVTVGANLASADLPTYTGSLTSLQVTTALGFTPYSAANPAGYTSNLGTVTAVTGTSPVDSTGGTTPVISLSNGYGDTKNPYGSKAGNLFLASPNGSPGVPSFRAIVAADIPTLNQNTTGTASNVTGVVAVVNGGTGVTTSTGSGSVVLSTSPSLTTPSLGVATGTSFNSITGLSSTTPLADSGSGVIGTSTTVARADHQHPVSGVTSFSAGTTGLTPSTGTAGAVTLAGTLAIANGGTNATTAAGARSSLLPSYTGNAQKVLQVNAGATDVEWATPSSGSSLTNNTQSITDNDITASVATRYLLNLSGLTDLRDFVLPAPTAIGDQIEIVITSGNTSRTVTTGSVSAGSTSLTVASASGLATNQRIRIDEAGPLVAFATNHITTINSISGTTVTLADAASVSVTNVAVVTLNYELLIRGQRVGSNWITINGGRDAISVTVDTTTDAFTAVGHNLNEGDPVYFTGTTLPGGISANTIYYVRRVTIETANNANAAKHLTFTVSTTRGGATLNITTTGTSVSVVPLEWSRLFMTRESVTLTATSLTNWQVTADGRIPIVMRLGMSTAQTFTSTTTATRVRFDTVVLDNSAGALVATGTTGSSMILRRSNPYILTAALRLQLTTGILNGNLVYIDLPRFSLWVRPQTNSRGPAIPIFSEMMGSSSYYGAGTAPGLTLVTTAAFPRTPTRVIAGWELIAAQNAINGWPLDTNLNPYPNMAVTEVLT